MRRWVWFVVLNYVSDEKMIVLVVIERDEAT